jgi:alkylation response protein AidB-like acyl-CoA dehydrogenase
MDFRFSTEEEAFRREVKDFIVVEWPKSQQSGDSFTKKLAARGWLTMSWPSAYGGQDAPVLKQLVYNEEMAYAGAPGQTMGADRFGPTIILYGSDEQKAEHLPRIVADEVTWCQGFSEPGSGSDLASLQTKAVRDGDEFIINGQKIWTSNAQNAQFMGLLARTDPNAPKHRGITFFILDMRSPGVTVQPLVQMTGESGFNQVFFENVRIPATNVIGEIDRGWYVATATLDFERSGIHRVIGGLKLLEDVIEYAKQAPSRRPGYRTLYDVPLVRLKLADFKLQYEVGRLLSYRVGWMQSRQMVPNYEASIAKIFGTELRQKVAAYAINMLGLSGQVTSGEWAPLAGRVAYDYLQTVSLTIAAGTSEINRNIVATRGLGMPRS